MHFRLSCFVSLVVAICFMSSSLSAMGNDKDKAQGNGQDKSNTPVRPSNSSAAEVNTFSFSTLTGSDYFDSSYTGFFSSSSSLSSSSSSYAGSSSSSSASSSSNPSSSSPALAQRIGTHYMIVEGRNNSTTARTSSASNTTQTQAMLTQQELLTEFSEKIQHHYGRLAELQKIAEPWLQEAQLLDFSPQSKLANRYQKLHRCLAKYKKMIDDEAQKGLKLVCAGKLLGKENYQKIVLKAVKRESSISRAIGELKRELLRHDIKSSNTSTSETKSNSKDNKSQKSLHKVKFL